MLLIRQLQTYSVLKLESGGQIPAIPANTDYWSITITDDERSLVCLTADAPVSGVAERADNWCAFRVAGTMEFSLTGIVAQISGVLAEAKIGIFVLSTFDTDYILVANPDAASAMAAWRTAGIEVLEPLHFTPTLAFVDLFYEIEAVASNSREGKTWAPDYPHEGDLRVSALLLAGGDPAHVDPPGYFQIRLRGSGVAVGGIGFKGEHVSEELTAMEIGYALAVSQQGQGLGTQAIAGLIEIAKSSGITKLCAKTDLDNFASHKALTRNGFVENSRSASGIWWERSVHN